MSGMEEYLNHTQNVRAAIAGTTGLGLDFEARTAELSGLYGSDLMQSGEYMRGVGSKIQGISGYTDEEFGKLTDQERIDVLMSRLDDGGRLAEEANAALTEAVNQWMLDEGDGNTTRDALLTRIAIATEQPVIMVNGTPTGADGTSIELTGADNKFNQYRDR
jgi:hypothetical protein